MTDEGATWVTLNEASARAGVSVSWLRKQYRRHGLPTIEVAGSRGPQKAVPLEEVLIRAASFMHPPGLDVEQGPSVPPRPQPAATDDASLLERLIEAEARAAQSEAESAYLRLRLEDAFAEIDRLRHQISVLVEPPRG
ncbi:MAG: hypothetical protein ACRD12_11215 [Acidimicrobiales bacterium]